MSVWIQLAEKVETRGKRFAILLACLITVPVLASDWATGLLPWTGFYLFPIALLAWVVSRRAALVYAAVVPVITYAGFVVVYHGYAFGWFGAAHIPLRMVTFTMFAYLFSALREALKREQRHVRRLRQINTDLDRFAVAASHDLQAPLGRILSFIDLVRGSDLCRAETKEHQYLDRAAVSALRLRKLVEDMLIFARVGRGERSFVTTDLNAVADRVLEDLSDRIADASATIQRSPLPTATVVANDFYELLLNLVANALRYRRPDVPPVVTLSGGITDGSAWIEVADNGRGIEESDLQRIFEPFERGSAAPNGGTGIGLAICRRVVESHQGRLTVKSRVNEGSIFRAEFPLTPSDRRAARPETPLFAAAGR